MLDTFLREVSSGFAEVSERVGISGLFREICVWHGIAVCPGPFCEFIHVFLGEDFGIDHMPTPLFLMETRPVSSPPP